MQQSPDLEKTNSKKGKSCLKGTKYNRGRRVYVEVKSVRNDLNIVLHQ